MTGQELMEALQALSWEERNLAVYLYLDNSEDGNFAGDVEIRSAEKEPYHKGDGPWSSGDAKETERLLFIR